MPNERVGGRVTGPYSQFSNDREGRPTRRLSQSGGVVVAVLVRDRLLGVPIRTDTHVSARIDRHAAEWADGPAASDGFVELGRERGTLLLRQAGPDGWLFLVGVDPQLVQVEDDGPVARTEAHAQAADAEVVVGHDGEVGHARRRRLIVVLELCQHLLERQAERLKLFLLEPERGGLGRLTDELKAEGALARLAERLHVGAADEAEVCGHDSDPAVPGKAGGVRCMRMPEAYAGEHVDETRPPAGSPYPLRRAGAVQTHGRSRST